MHLRDWCAVALALASLTAATWSWRRENGRSVATIKAVQLRDDEHRLGTRDAQAVLLVFSDFECPFCGRFARDVMPQIDREFLETGRAQLIFRHFPLTSIHPFAARAAEAAECAGTEGRFWQMHDLLFTNQSALDEVGLRSSASVAGLDSGRFDRCMSGATAKRLADDTATASELALRSTPALLVGRLGVDLKMEVVGYLRGLPAMEDVRKLMDDLERRR